jgi:Fe2+ transport system protein FeoA
MRASNPNQPVPLCSVLELRRGARAVVRGFVGEDLVATRALAQRLVAMGLPIGTEAEVLVQRGRGPILLRAREARIALGQDEARCVRVEAVDALAHKVATTTHGGGSSGR